MLLPYVLPLINLFEARNLFQLIAEVTYHAGIIDSAEAQMKLNLNECVCTDMNVC